jgi:hypothetical protein
MIAHRTLWSVLWAGGLVLLAKQGGQVAAVLRQPKTLMAGCCCRPWRSSATGRSMSSRSTPAT